MNKNGGVGEGVVVGGEGVVVGGEGVCVVGGEGVVVGGLLLFDDMEGMVVFVVGFFLDDVFLVGVGIYV